MNTRSHISRWFRILPPMLLGVAALGVVILSSDWSPDVAGGVASERSANEAKAWTERVFARPTQNANVRSVPNQDSLPDTPRPADRSEAEPRRPSTSAQPPASLPGLPALPTATPSPEAPSPTQTFVPPASTPAPSCPTAGMAGFAAALFDAVNGARVANGMGALAADGCVTYVAQLRSQDMAANSYFAHTGSDGETAFSLMDSYGVPYAWAGENLARNNYPDAETVAVAIRDLMASEGHRANILHNRYTRLGVGFAIDGEGIRYYTMIFTGS